MNIVKNSKKMKYFYKREFNLNERNKDIIQLGL